jgi:nucleoid-associated protein YgaU
MAQFSNNLGQIKTYMKEVISNPDMIQVGWNLKIPKAK